MEIREDKLGRRRRESVVPRLSVRRGPLGQQVYTSRNVASTACTTCGSCGKAICSRFLA